LFSFYKINEPGKNTIKKHGYVASQRANRLHEQRSALSGLGTASGAQLLVGIVGRIGGSLSGDCDELNLLRCTYSKTSLIRTNWERTLVQISESPNYRGGHAVA
jgi:hypothetical protein